MSLSISAVSANDAQYDPTPAPKPASKPTESQQIEQLALQGQSAQQIASTVGLPESLVSIDLGTSSSSSTSAVSQASALLSLGARLSVQV